MENNSYMHKGHLGVSIMDLNIPFMEQDIIFEIFSEIQIILIFFIIVLLYNYKRAETAVSGSSLNKRFDDDSENCNQMVIKMSLCLNDTEFTLIPKTESEYNIHVTISARKFAASQEYHEGGDCLDQKLEVSQKLPFDLRIQYNVKKGLDSCEMRDQCDCNTKDTTENLSKDAFDDVSHYNEINVSLFNCIQIKHFECPASFFTVYSHHPAEINKIPWRLMNKEWWRLHTFSKYPRNAPLSSILLARQGFVYIGNGNSDDDTVICVFCLSAAKDLGRDTDIEVLHLSLNSNCPIVKGLDCQNIKIKEFDGNLVSYILSKINKFNINQSSTNSGLQYEDQILPLEADSPEEPSPSSSFATAHALDNAHAGNQVSLVNNNSVHDTSCHQATENNASYVVVTNRAQSLSFPGTDVADIGASNRIYEAQQLATPDARPDAAPLPTSKPHSDVPRSDAATPRQNPDRNSESSRPHTQSNSSNSHTNRPQEVRNDTSSSQTNSENSTSSQPQTNADEPPPSNTTSYDKLGIITARPKRPEYAVEITRLNSFEGWPQDHHIKAEDLAKAGYFYTGYSDCARCFYCGGGLRNWEVGDDVWVEHARWFPKCAFMRQIMGQPFIDVVQDLNKEKEIIPYEDVIAEMKYRGLKHAIPKEIKDRSMDLERDAAVKTIVDNGFNVDDTVMAAEKLRETGQSLSADVIYEELERRKVTRKNAGLKTDDDSQSVSKKRNGKRDQEMFESLRGENNQLRQQSQCKICMDKEVSVVFLPCGHFVSCNDCSFALKICPVCRDMIKGVVRAFLK